MSVKEEVEGALKELLLPELQEIKQGLADLKENLDEITKRVGRIGRPKDDFDHLEDLQAGGLTEEQAMTLVRAKYAISQAAKADLDEVGIKVEGDLKGVGFNPKMAQTIVDYMKDRLAS